MDNNDPEQRPGDALVYSFKERESDGIGIIDYSGRPIVWIDRHDRRCVVWIALTGDDVRGIVNEEVTYKPDPMDIIRDRLTEMAEDGTLEIDRDYTVTGTAIMDVTMTHTVQARSVEAAKEAFYRWAGRAKMDDYEVDEVRDADILDISPD